MSFNDSEDTSSHRYNEDSSEFSGAPDGDGKEYPGANEREGKSDSKGAVRDSWAKIADELDAAEAPDAGCQTQQGLQREFPHAPDHSLAQRLHPFLKLAHKKCFFRNPLQITCKRAGRLNKKRGQLFRVGLYGWR